MTRPVRIQLSRQKDWRLQEVSRAINGLPAKSVARPGLWGSPFRIGDPGVPDAATAVRLFAEWLTPFRHGDDLKQFIISDINMHAVQDDLHGHNLACWCPLDTPCHADILLEIAR